MKRVFVISVFCVTVLSAFAQTYERSGGNIGFEFGLLPTVTTTDQEIMKGPPGFSYELGVSREFFGFMSPGITFRYFSGTHILESATNGGPISLEDERHMESSSITVPITFRIPFWGLSIGKSNSYECMGLNIALIAGPEMAFNLNNTSHYNIQSRHTLQYFAGLSFSPTRSGGAKGAQRNTWYFDLIYERGGNVFEHTDATGKKTEWNQQFLGLRVHWYLFKVYQFSNM